MKILWLTWKDYTHPQAGGAEIVLRELSKRLVHDGHEVSFLTVRHTGSESQVMLDGINIIRVGTNRYAHPFQALAYYLRHLRKQYDIVIEVVNTAPYFAALFKGDSKMFVFYHQLAREIWFHELKKPFSYFGYHIIEPLATHLLSRAKAKLITISQSTLKDLEHFGFNTNNAHVISEGIEIEPLSEPDSVSKFSQPTMLSLGAMRAMKRTIDQVKAFEKAKAKLPALKLIMAGQTDGPYAQTVLDYVRNSPFAKDIAIEGKVSRARKEELMRRSHVVILTSVKEGWGLVVTEANSQGTPAVVYDVDGLRDSVRDKETGIICKTNPAALADGIIELLSDPVRYEQIRHAGWEWSRSITFEKSYSDFKEALELA
jgi:glycosyltransferase involved in cell wall biosynthesis